MCCCFKLDIAQARAAYASFMQKSAAGDAARHRIAIVDADRCRPKKCGKECKKFCPVVHTNKPCIEVDKDSVIAKITEKLCIGCGICIKKCPFQAITIVNLPKELSATEAIHRYGQNAFRLHRLPIPRAGQVLGIVGTNGIGKSTALSVLSGRVKPNLGHLENPPEWQEILSTLKGGDLQIYFERMVSQNLRAVVKPQYVDHIQRRLAGSVGEILKMKDDRGVLQQVAKELDLTHLLARDIQQISGGELQRFAIGLLCLQRAEVYMFDEPSSFLDVKQRLQAASSIRALLHPENYIVVVEHDLAVLDYLSDWVCCMWGSPSAYGVVTMPFSVREGINIFLDGKIPTENLRFREVSLNFKLAPPPIELEDDLGVYPYPRLAKNMGGGRFSLEIAAGDFKRGEIIVMLGQNGTGKTTFIRMLAGMLKPDGLAEGEGLPELTVSYKPQTVNPKFRGSVRELLMSKIGAAFQHPQFQVDVAQPMLIDQILDRELQNISGGELQRVALVLALGTPAHLYLLDEPSAYLDAEQRVVASRVIKNYVLTTKATAFVVEHDFLMATYLADRVIVYQGEPGVKCAASSPQALVEGMNTFLRQLGITFRRDPSNYRPRINKVDSIKDREQKEAGKYFLLEA